MVDVLVLWTALTRPVAASAITTSYAQEPGVTGMTINMMLGAAVLIATQFVLVAVAVAWYRRSVRDAPESGAPEQEHKQHPSPPTTAS